MWPFKNSLMRPDDLHLCGFSLGGHVVGFAGKRLQSVSNPVLIHKITALDPAGPEFENKKCAERVCETDAHWVEAIHTNGNGLGI